MSPNVSVTAPTEGARLRVHHLNCGTMCPIGGGFTAGPGRRRRGRLVCHCLLLETGPGLVLVDTGLGLADIGAPRARLSPLFLNLLGIRLDPEATAVRQVERLGFRGEDVRHIILTHLDCDHAGGLEDFPQARVHLYDAEAEAATHPASFIDGGRYRRQQWGSLERWNRHVAGGEPWFGFDCVRDVPDLPPEVLLVPLVGHSRGHCGVAVRSDAGWLFHAGDAYFFQGEIDPDRPWCPPGLRAYQAMMEVDRAARLRNQARLRALARDHTAEVRVFPAHDAEEWEAWAAGRPDDRGAGRHAA